MPQSEKPNIFTVTGVKLDATLELPDGTTRAYALLLHKLGDAGRRISAHLAARGIAVLTLGGTDDAAFAAGLEYLRRHHAGPAVLRGHGAGSAAVLNVAASVDEARAICLIGAELSADAPVDHISNLRKALLVFHSPIDDVAGIENASRIFVAARHPKSFVSLDGANHGLTTPTDADYVGEVTAAWATRYIGTLDGIAPLVARGVEGAVVVEETGQGRFSNAVNVNGNHMLLADEPSSHGGDDTGPNPYDLLVAGLGACKSMTLRMYAERKGIPLERARVTLRHRKIHAEDCAECETETEMVDDIAVEIELFGDLDTETRQRLFEIADRCPVHRTLHGEIHIASRLVD
jgi:uncharacterized OsmC-like protein